MRKKKHVCLLADFFNCDYYEAYKEMIHHLSPLLQTKNENPLLIERLDFRPDLQRGDKGVIYAELAQLLRSGPGVLKKKFCKNDLFRWLADPRHTNLCTSFQKIKRAVYQCISDGI